MEWERVDGSGGGDWWWRINALLNLELELQPYLAICVSHPQARNPPHSSARTSGRWGETVGPPAYSSVGRAPPNARLTRLDTRHVTTPYPPFPRHYGNTDVDAGFSQSRLFTQIYGERHGCWIIIIIILWEGGILDHALTLWRYGWSILRICNR